MVTYDGNLNPIYPEHTFLGQISPETKAELERLWTPTRYSAKQIVLSTEETSLDVLFLLEGDVRVANYSPKGREVLFSNIEEGDCFGEFAVIDGAPRSANVQATTACRMARVGEGPFREMLARRPDMSMAIMRRLVAKLREMTQRVSDFTALRADDRIRLEFVRMFRAVQRSDGSALIDRPPTQAELAARVFTNREAVAREVGQMRKRGLLDKEGRAMIVPSVDALEAYQIERANREE
ncbi:MAG: Crp/Fnr family transcriptional regulator [Pseudomonadota bacterium]